MWSATRGGCFCAHRPGDTRGGFGRASSAKLRPGTVDARAAASAASSTSTSWGAPGERRDIAGDGSIRVSEACVSAECWASTRALDERVAHDRLSAAVESDVNFVDAGVPPEELPGDARFARWLRQRGGRREDLVVGGHLSPGAFATRESPSYRSAVTLGNGNDTDERVAAAIDPKRAYRSVDDAIDRLLLSTGAEWLDVLHVPWLCSAPVALRGRRRFERIAPRDSTDAGGHDRWHTPDVTRGEAPFTTAMDLVRWVPIGSTGGGFESDPGSSSVASETFVPAARFADARFSAVRQAHRAALFDAVRGGKVRALCVSFETPWDACGLELGDSAFFEAWELAERLAPGSSSPGSASGLGSFGDAVAGVSLSLSALRDPRLARRGDDYEATLARWCTPGAQERRENDVAAFPNRKPVVAARDAFFPGAAVAGARGSSALAEAMVRAASAFGAFTREDVALGLARAGGYAASVAMGGVSSCASTEAMDDETFARRLAAFAPGGAGDEATHLDAACLAAVDAARLKHFRGVSDAERGRGRGRGRGRDPFEARDEDRA